MKTAIVALSGAVLILLYVIAVLIMALRMAWKQLKDNEAVISPITLEKEEDDARADR